MFDFLRNLTKSNEDKERERLSAYLDNALTPQERLAFEEELKGNTTLQASLEQERFVKQNLNGLPRMRAPRNFTLDPALYGRPTSSTVFRLYPVMRTATALAAIVLIFLFSLDLFTTTAYERADDQTQSVPSETSDGFSGETAVGETAVEESAPAVPEIFGETGGDRDVIVEQEVEEAAEEAMEEAMAEPAVAESAEESEAPVEEALDGEGAPSANGGAAPAEEAAASATDTGTLVEEDEGAANANTSGGAAAGDLPPAKTPERTTVTTTEAGSVGTLSPALTPTQRLSQTTGLADDGIYAYGVETQSDSANETGTKNLSDAPISSRRLLQIGLGILFLTLLAATLLLRRQL